MFVDFELERNTPSGRIDERAIASRFERLIEIILLPRDGRKLLFTAITSLSQDITVLFIEHDMELVFRLASRIIVMVGGSILLEGTPQQIAADPRVREVYLGGAQHG